MARRLRLVLLAGLVLPVLAGPAAAGAAAPVRLVRVTVPTPGAAAALDALGLDVAAAPDARTRDVVAWTSADLVALRRSHLAYRALPGAAARSRGRRARPRAVLPALPSGRTAYRHLADYDADMTALASRDPVDVRAFTLPHPSLEGRPIRAIEIARHVQANDGRPVFLLMGLHHAREWPSGEITMEFGVDMVNRLLARDPRVTDLLSRARLIVVPVVNPDGFNVSREAPGSATLDPGLEWKRKNCRVVDGAVPAPGACEAASALTLGTDLNRNYGGLWGGAGASLDPRDDTYRGAGPFSEPEAQNIHELVSSRQVVTLVSNHTWGNDILRPPGVRDVPTPDEAALSGLGSEMASAAPGYTSSYSYGLYDTTGGTEDWTYWSTGGLGYTIEIGPDLGGDGLIAFHPDFASIPAQYFGTGGAGSGLRESLLRGLASTAGTARHAVITGSGQPGSTIEVTKRFRTATSPVLDADGLAGPPQTFPDTLDTRMTIPASGTFADHVNPSTRPLVAGRPGRSPHGPLTASSSFVSALDTTSFSGSGDPPAGSYHDFPFTVGAGDDDALATVRIQWPDSANDFDLGVWRKEASGPDTLVGSSAQGGTDWESARVLPDEPNGSLAAGDYYARVYDYDSTDKQFTGTIGFSGPTAPVPPRTEAWTLRCLSPAGTVLGSRSVVVARGGHADVGAVCGPETGPPVHVRARAGRVSLDRALQYGFPVKVRCSSSCTASATASLDGERVGRAPATADARPLSVVRVLFTRKARHRLAHRRSVTLTVRVRAVGPGDGRGSVTTGAVLVARRR